PANANATTVICSSLDVSSCFFFSSRGRHTRFSRDWSSDVCSSDLGMVADSIVCDRFGCAAGDGAFGRGDRARRGDYRMAVPDARSEERRVGEECGDRRGGENEEKSEGAALNENIVGATRAEAVMQI